MRRTPWGLESGGPGSGLYRSADEGETWTEVTGGLPAGLKGKIGVAVSGGENPGIVSAGEVYVERIIYARNGARQLNGPQKRAGGSH